MDNYIKWEECDKWADDFNPRTGDRIKNAHHITRELVCSHPAVERVWFHGSMSQKPESIPSLNFEMIFHNGDRLHLADVQAEYFESGHIQRAEAYLNSLNESV